MSPSARSRYVDDRCTDCLGEGVVDTAAGEKPCTRCHGAGSTR